MGKAKVEIIVSFGRLAFLRQLKLTRKQILAVQHISVKSDWGGAGGGGGELGS